MADFIIVRRLVVLSMDHLAMMGGMNAWIPDEKNKGNALVLRIVARDLIKIVHICRIDS